MARRTVLTYTSIFFSILWLWAVIAFDKWGASWWGISVWVFVLVSALVLVGVAALLGLFNADSRTPTLVLCGLVLFVVLSLGEGVFISEPSLHPSHVQNTSASSHDVSHSNFFYSYWHESTTSSTSSTASHSSSNSKNGGYVILFLLLIALLILSAILPHFWVAAVFVGVVLLWCFTAKEVKQKEE